MSGTSSIEVLVESTTASQPNVGATMEVEKAANIEEKKVCHSKDEVHCGKHYYKCNHYRQIYRQKTNKYPSINDALVIKNINITDEKIIHRYIFNFSDGI